MLIKEYRIPMPLSVEEYRIAQLYMIQKKSREESQGTESGVEIIENEPYVNGPGGNGQHTLKVYHIGKHIPGWLVSLLPKDALIVEEEAWNAYPYTRTRYTCPFVEKFLIDIETVYFNDVGQRENPFKLSSTELRNSTIDVIDIVKEKSGDYKKEEDPKIYKSKVTGRGPLTDEWLANYKSETSNNHEKFMCAYKRCKVEFKYWGMQSKIERFIHDTGLRKVMLRAHKQAWCWQDEWHGLTMDDIRRLEKETQLALRRKFGVVDDDDEISDAESNASENFSVSSDSPVPTSSSTSSQPQQSSTVKKVRNQQSPTASLISSRSKLNNSERYHSQLNLLDGKLEGIRRYSSGEDTDDEDEFYDCNDGLDEDDISNHSGDSYSPKWASMEDLAKSSSSAGFEIESAADDKNQRQSSLDTEESDQVDNFSTYPCKVNTLILVFHGGNAVENFPSSKQNDLQTLKSTFETVIQAHYRNAMKKVAFRLIDCPTICKDAFRLLQSLNPGTRDDSAELCASSSLLALFAAASAQYQEAVSTLATMSNLVYNNFIDSPEGKGFEGQVCLISDMIGSVLTYDMLCRSSKHYTGSTCSSRRGSSLSYCEEDSDGLHLSAPSSPNLKVHSHYRWETSSAPRRNSTASFHHSVGSLHADNTFLSVSDSKRSRSSQQTRSSSFSDPPAPIHTRHVSESPSSDLSLKLDFEVSDFFMLGSPLAVVLAMRQLGKANDISAVLSQSNPMKPACQNIYNLFYSADPSAARIEPLLDIRFANLPCAAVVSYRQLPLGNGKLHAIGDFLATNIDVFSDGLSRMRRSSDWSLSSGLAIDSQTSNQAQQNPMSHDQRQCVSGQSYNQPGNNNAQSAVAAVASRWWGEKRIDYSLFCPDALTGFPASALPHLFHSSFWESLDLAAFVLRQIIKQEFAYVRSTGGKSVLFAPKFETEKWLKKRTAVKISNVTANHRARDIIVLENQPQAVSGRFVYGPLDVANLTGEKVDLYALLPPPSPEWLYLSTDVTGNHGKLTCVIPEAKRLGMGIYPIKMVVRGDQTSANCYMAVIPSNMDCVVFSIDGAFTASMSIMGSDAKVQPGAVDVVRHWQDLGYLILYVTARPDLQKHRVVTWLAQHNYPQGMTWFSDGFSHEPLKHKAQLLKNLKTECKLNFAAAYGSAKDISVYSQLEISPERIFIIGKASKKQAQQCCVISDGYSTHLTVLNKDGGILPAKYNAQMHLHKSTFDRPSSRKSRSFSKKKSLRAGAKKQIGFE